MCQENSAVASENYDIQRHVSDNGGILLGASSSDVEASGVVTADTHQQSLTATPTSQRQSPSLPTPHQTTPILRRSPRNHQSSAMKRTIRVSGESFLQDYLPGKVIIVF